LKSNIVFFYYQNPIIYLKKTIDFFVYNQTKEFGFDTMVYHYYIKIVWFDKNRMV